MGLLYFFFLGIIFTLMSLDNNNAFTSKKLLINKDKKAPVLKVIFGILTAWFFAGNALLFFWISGSFINSNKYNITKFVKNIFQLVNFINVFIMPFLLFKRVLVRDKNKE
jgi:hypothetical protein